jgi:predicted AAA+ superfamily ATPase
MAIVGREREIEELKRYKNTGRPEFVAVFGRRRVGKTFLIREYFENDFLFYFTGTVGRKRLQQLNNFDIAIQRYGGNASMPSKNWSGAFLKLQDLIENAPGNRRQIVFLDELRSLKPIQIYS